MPVGLTHRDMAISGTMNLIFDSGAEGNIRMSDLDARKAGQRLQDLARISLNHYKHANLKYRSGNQ